MTFIRTLCPACQATAAAQIADAIPVDNDLGILDVFCPHALVGAEILIVAGIVVDWSVRPFRDVDQFERFNAGAEGTTPGGDTRRPGVAHGSGSTKALRYSQAIAILRAIVYRDAVLGVLLAYRWWKVRTGHTEPPPGKRLFQPLKARLRPDVFDCVARSLFAFLARHRVLAKLLARCHRTKPSPVPPNSSRADCDPGANCQRARRNQRPKRPSTVAAITRSSAMPPATAT